MQNAGLQIDEVIEAYEIVIAHFEGVAIPTKLAKAAAITTDMLKTVKGTLHAKSEKITEKSDVHSKTDNESISNPSTSN